VHWIRKDLSLLNGETMQVMAKNSLQPLQRATLHQFENGMYVAFDEPQSAITKGQFVAWYLGEELVDQSNFLMYCFIKNRILK
jgi:tRNA-specific 2-thiouridylase